MILGAFDDFLFIFIAVCLVLSLFGPWSLARGETRGRLTTLESKVDKILDHLGLEHDTPEEQVEQLVARGLKIQAIKLYQEQNGVGLVEAKDAVEGIAAMRRARAGR